MTDRVARSLLHLREQINARWPNRKTGSDGTFGDPAHAARGSASDHNPWLKVDGEGIVTGIDITTDPAHGVDARKIVDTLVASRDDRIKYIIFDRQICSSEKAPWTWRAYHGESPHTEHFHLSSDIRKARFDNERDWKLPGDFIAASVPPVVVPGVKPRRLRMAKVILSYEARRNAAGKIAVYQLPANDGGGTYEVAGINDKFHPTMAAKLRALVVAGKPDEAEELAIAFIADYTDGAARWTKEPGVEFYLRDCIFNRGAKGAARILQMALGWTYKEADGQVGDQTLGKLKTEQVAAFLPKLRLARERYELAKAGYRANFWKGLVSRWDKALQAAKDFQKEGAMAGAVGTMLVTSAPPSTQKHKFSGTDWLWLGMGIVLLAVAVYVGIRWWRNTKRVAVVV